MPGKGCGKGGHMSLKEKAISSLGKKQIEERGEKFLDFALYITDKIFGVKPKQTIKKGSK